MPFRNMHSGRCFLAAVDQVSAEVPLEQLLDELDCTAKGLSTTDAANRLQRYGPNEISERRRNPVLIFLGYFWAPIPWMIEVALVLSVLVRHWTDAAIIGVLLLMNGVVAFVEEHQAAGAIAALKKGLASSARALRDGAWSTVAVRELVPGDVVRVRLGDVVPADLRVLEDVTIEVDQSALTGESLAVPRGRGQVLYSGSVLVRGEADAVVYATGASSFMGKTTALVQTAGSVSRSMPRNAARMIRSRKNSAEASPSRSRTTARPWPICPLVPDSGRPRISSTRTATWAAFTR